MRWVVLAVGGFLAWAAYTGNLASFLARMKPFEDFSCDDFVAVAMPQPLRNVFGGSFRIISVSDVRQVERSGTELQCNAAARLDNGMSVTLVMTAEVEGDQILYQFETR